MNKTVIFIQKMNTYSDIYVGFVKEENIKSLKQRKCYDNLNIIKTPRDYFGPVNLQIMNIQLLDEYGRILDLNNMDWSLTLELELLYEGFNFKNINSYFLHKAKKTFDFNNLYDLKIIEEYYGLKRPNPQDFNEAKNRLLSLSEFGKFKKIWQQVYLLQLY